MRNGCFLGGKEEVDNAILFFFVEKGIKWLIL
mgnify:CR=1 FL=1